MSDMKTLSSADLPRLPPRPIDAYKTSVGSVLVVAGSYGMAGAAYLAAAGALGAGAGYVRVACPENVYPILAGLLPSAVFVPLSCSHVGVVESSEVIKVVEALKLSTAAVIGPGLSREATVAHLFYSLLEQATIPKVIDADGLWFLAKQPASLEMFGPDAVLTPHPGEMAGLLGIETAAVQADRPGAVRALAERFSGVAVLKGARTLVCDSQRLYENTSGNAGMAKAGSGDVLAGAIGGLLAQGMTAFDAAALGVYLHGKAGDAGAWRKGRALTPEDILEALPEVLNDYENGHFERGCA